MGSSSPGDTDSPPGQGAYRSRLNKAYNAARRLQTISLRLTEDGLEVFEGEAIPQLSMRLRSNGSVEINVNISGKDSFREYIEAAERHLKPLKDAYMAYHGITRLACRRGEQKCADLTTVKDGIGGLVDVYKELLKGRIIGIVERDESPRGGLEGNEVITIDNKGFHIAEYDFVGTDPLFYATLSPRGEVNVMIAVSSPNPIVFPLVERGISGIQTVYKKFMGWQESS